MPKTSEKNVKIRKKVVKRVKKEHVTDMSPNVEVMSKNASDMSRTAKADDVIIQSNETSAFTVEPQTEAASNFDMPSDMSQGTKNSVPFEFNPDSDTDVSQAQTREKKVDTLELVLATAGIIAAQLTKVPELEFTEKELAQLSDACAIALPEVSPTAGAYMVIAAIFTEKAIIYVNAKRKQKAAGIYDMSQGTNNDMSNNVNDMSQNLRTPVKDMSPNVEVMSNNVEIMSRTPVTSHVEVSTDARTAAA